jgi:signal transduction histidine kinase
MADRESRRLSAVQRYGIAVLSVCIALTLAILGRSKFRDTEVPLFLFAVALAAWYGGPGPAAVAVLLASGFFAYFFTEPIYSFYIQSSDIPFFVMFVAFALLIAWFSTLRRRVERNLQEARDKLEGLNHELTKRSVELQAINKELEAFAYSVSHDLRAPLRHVAGYSELLQKSAAGMLDDKSGRYIALIQDSAKRMGMLIDDLLSFSRIGRTETRVTMVSLDQLVREIQGEVRRETEGRSVTWKIGALPNLYGDHSMLRIALVNLILNAVKFTRHRADAVIEIGCAEPKADGVVLFVRDNGVGFDMKYVNKLFGVFQRLHKADEFEGTGIGLATVQRIIHRHGGQVWAEGELGAGATFYVQLPTPSSV